MRSRTSCFNATIFKKNLTRFAPAWGLYTLCLVLGTLLVYSNGGTMKYWHFANNMTQMPQYMALINMAYAPVVAQLLFGDLFSGRMCNALHAMPIRRESWFFTNILSGLTFSILPGLVMAMLSTVLCSGSLIENAWQIPWLTLAASTLQFICFYGISIFATMCAGNRLGMLLIYGLLNAGAFIAYWLVDTVYTPMLYGVNTPSKLVEALTPIANMLDNRFIETEHEWWTLKELFGEKLEGASSSFSLVPETWMNLLVWVAAGVVFALIGLVLYKKRDLECAGDTLAFHVLEPVFQVLGSVVCAGAAQFFLYMFIGTSSVNYLFLASGLVVGWFACRMLIERNTRVFQMKNWVGLACLTAVIAVSLFLTHVDILGIEEWQPEAEDVASVEISYGTYELTDKEDIQKIIDIQSEALETRLESGNAYGYIQNEAGEWVMFEGNAAVNAEELAQLSDLEGRYAFYINMVYHMESGKDVSRSYVLWADGQAGDHYRNILSRWELVNSDAYYVDNKETEEKVLTRVLADMDEIYIDGHTLKASEMTQEKLTELAKDFLSAVKADCAEGNMAQNGRLHKGHFRKEHEDASTGYSYRPSLSVSLRGTEDNWYIDIFPDSHHTIKWLQEHDLLDFEIRDNILVWY